MVLNATWFSLRSTFFSERFCHKHQSSFLALKNNYFQNYLLNLVIRPSRRNIVCGILQYHHSNVKILHIPFLHFHKCFLKVRKHIYIKWKLNNYFQVIFLLMLSLFKACWKLLISSIWVSQDLRMLFRLWKFISGCVCFGLNSLSFGLEKNSTLSL